VKHGVRVSVVNLYDDQFGNAKLPRKFEAVQKRQARVRWAEVAVALLVLTAIIAAFVLLLRRPAPSALTVAEKSIAVLPFSNLSKEERCDPTPPGKMGRINRESRKGGQSKSKGYLGSAKSCLQLLGAAEFRQG
jgi:hypothetical protein